MEGLTELAVLLAINGALVVMISMGAGLALYRVILSGGEAHDWHLLHAGGTSRGIMLIALGAAAELPALPVWQTWTAMGLIVLFVWTSVAAMLLRALSGERGFDMAPPETNQAAFLLYAVGTVSVFTGFAWLLVGLLRAV